MSLAPVLWVLENMQECLLKATDFGKHLRLKSDFRQDRFGAAEFR